MIPRLAVSALDVGMSQTRATSPPIVDLVVRAAELAQGSPRGAGKKLARSKLPIGRSFICQLLHLGLATFRVMARFLKPGGFPG